MVRFERFTTEYLEIMDVRHVFIFVGSRLKVEVCSHTLQVLWSRDDGLGVVIASVNVRKEDILTHSCSALMRGLR